MNNKNLGVGLSSILAVLMLIVMASAFSLSTTNVIFDPSTSVQEITATDTGLTVSPLTLNINNEKGGSVSFNVATTIVGSTTKINITPTAPIDFANFYLGKSYPTTVDLNVTKGTETHLVKVSLEKTFCKSGVNGSDFDVDVDIKNNGYGEEDTDWYPLDEIEIRVDLDNNGADDISKINIESCLFNPSDGRCILDEDDMDFDDNNFRIKDGDSKRVTAKFQVNPDDIDPDTDDYILYIKAYSKDLGEANLCNEYSEDIRIIRDSHFVVLTDITGPETVECDSDETITADVWNIGDDDEKDVYVIVYNKELGINEKVEIGDIDILEMEKMDFSFHIPQNSKEKSYLFELTVFDEDDDVFENDNDDKAQFTQLVTVEGNCVVSVLKGAQIIVPEGQLEDIRAGEEAVIKATVKNTGEEKTTYTIGVDGNELFSSVQSINPSSLTLEAGKSGDVSVTLITNKDAEGINSFYITALFDGEKVRSDELQLSITPKFTITGSAIGASLKENWFIWVIVIVNIILIIAIILVVVRMSRV